MEQEVCQKCGTIIDNDLTVYYGFCSSDCYYSYMIEHDKEKLSLEYWDWK